MKSWVKRAQAVASKPLRASRCERPLCNGFGAFGPSHPCAANREQNVPRRVSPEPG